VFLRGRLSQKRKILMDRPWSASETVWASPSRYLLKTPEQKKKKDKE
jgi:hypothetical protein